MCPFKYTSYRLHLRDDLPRFCQLFYWAHSGSESVKNILFSFIFEEGTVNCSYPSRSSFKTNLAVIS